MAICATCGKPSDSEVPPEILAAEERGAQVFMICHACYTENWADPDYSPDAPLELGSLYTIERKHRLQ